METKIIEIDEKNIDYTLIQEAAGIIKNSGLVVFPTETVYGLGASALDPVAVKKIFEAKGRPSDNPLIVHVSDKSMIEDLIKNKEVLQQESYIQLMSEFWPGPLTIISQKNDNLCDEVTAGLSTVGIRMPESKIALKLIEFAGTGIAAPSANISGKPSPTSPEHVISDMNGRVDVILCGGNCNVGVESTVLDMTCDPPVILRPGGVSREDIEKVLGKNVLMAKGVSESNIPRAPGMKYKHYAPKGKLIVFYGEEDKVASEINKRVEEALIKGEKPRVLASRQTICYYKEYSALWGDREEPETFAKELYSALRYCDRCGAEIIFAEAVSGEGIGEAVMNRLLMASGYNTVNVK